MQFLFWELELFIDLKYGIYSFDGSTRWPGCQWGVHRSAHPLHPMQNVESKILASCVFPSSSFDFCSSVHTVNANAPRDFCFGSKFYGNELLTGSFFLFFQVFYSLRKPESSVQLTIAVMISLVLCKTCICNII